MNSPINIDESTADRRTDRLRRWGAPALLVVVALHQFARVQLQDLSSWRGGGFGMYGSYHPTHNDLWWIDSRGDVATRYAKKKGVATDDARRSDLRPFLTWPNAAALRRHLESLPAEERSGVSIGIWQLDYDPATGELARRRIARTRALSES